MKEQKLSEQYVNSVRNFFYVFILLSIIATTTYGIITKDIVSLEGGFKIAIVLVALNAVIQGIQTAVVFAATVFTLLILFYSTHLSYSVATNLIMYIVAYTSILIMYSTNPNVNERKIKYVEIGALYYVIASFAWTTTEEGVHWMPAVIAIPFAAFAMFLSYSKTLRNKGIVSYLMSVTSSIQSKINALVELYIKSKCVATSGRTRVFMTIKMLSNKVRSLKHYIGFERIDLDRKVGALSEVGGCLDTQLYKFISVMNSTTKFFTELEHRMTEKLRRISLAIEKLQYAMEHNFTLLLLLVSMFVLTALLIYIVVISS
ncbi:MAG: hypothetical protein QXV93_01485 [Zestosphaera sp.]